MDDSKIRLSIDNAIRSLYQAIIVVDREGHECHVVDFNKELCNIIDTPVDFDEFCESLYENIHPADREDFHEFTYPTRFPDELRARVFVSMECRVRHTDGVYYWSEMTFCHATEEESTIGGEYLFLIRDINDTKQKVLKRDSELLQALGTLSNKYDALFEENMRDQQTGCYNRKGEEYYEDIVLNKAKNEGKYVFVCVSDLSGLKHLNDTYGHEAGDIAIAEVAKELMASAPRGSKIVRTGGDEFLIFAALDKGSNEPFEMGDKFDAALKVYNEEHKENPFEVGASYGWVLLPVKDDMENLAEYTSIADKKMYEMKKKRDIYRR